MWNSFYENVQKNIVSVEPAGILLFISQVPNYCVEGRIVFNVVCSHWIDGTCDAKTKKFSFHNGPIGSVVFLCDNQHVATVVYPTCISLLFGGTNSIMFSTDLAQFSFEHGHTLFQRGLLLVA